jgi:hypothetical protein
MRRIASLLLPPLVVLAAAVIGAACSSDEDPAATGGEGGSAQATCGDGVIDPSIGETCDPPASCQPICCPCGPMDACVRYEVLGSGNTCNVRCEQTPITTCEADGCCVSTCADDPDCLCDAAPICDDCFQCAVAGACAPAVAACESSPACIDLVNCLQGCADEACADMCKAASTPEAVDQYIAWFSCALCDECPNACMGIGATGFPGCP